MTTPKAGEVKRGIGVIWENLQCPICLDLMTTPVSTKCDHQFCKFCIIKLLDRSKKKEASCPVCKTKVTKRSLQESPGFQRLVEGLQNLIQSYEFDTCTNYFTGMPQKTPEDSVETESRDQQFPGESPSPEVGGTEKARSPSSAAAKDAFARLMGLEDSCTANPEQDCSDSGLGYAPQISEKKQSEPENFLSGREGRPSSSSVDRNGDPNDAPSTSVKRSGLRSQSRVGLESDRIVDKRQKKSMEKVSEWLLKISPSSCIQTMHNSTVLSISSDSDCEKDSMCSSAPTEVIVKGNDKMRASLSRDPLVQEKQVFGAVYKREHKLAKTRVGRVSSPERAITTAPCLLNVAAEDNMRYMSKKKKKPSGKLTPADFIKKSSDDKGGNVDEQGEIEEPMEFAVRNADEAKKQEKVAESTRNVSLKCPDEKEKLIERSTDEECIGTIEMMENSPEFDVPVNRPERQSKVKMKDAWQDSDLKLKENKSANKKGQKRRLTRSSCGSAKDNELEESKNAKHTKALALVSAGNETLDFVQKLTSRPKLTEAEVTIESYPSSAEPRSPDSRKIRRSLRLQAFTAEVQVTRERRRAMQSLPKPADKPQSEPLCSANPPEVNDPITSANEGKAIPVDCQGRTADERPVKKNGCVYNSKFEITEVTEVQPSEGAAPLKSVTGEVEPQVSIVPDTMDSDGQNSPGSATVVRSPGPLAAGLLYSFSPEEHQEPPSAAASAPVLVGAVTATAITPAGENNIEEQGDTNDSELDTEQLLKTFKATKRKSFCLWSPRASYSKGQEGTLGKTVEDSELLQGPIPVCQSNGHNSSPANISHYDPFQPSNKGELSPSQKSSSPGNAGVASVTQRQATSSALALGSEEHVLLKNSEVSMSPALTPNKVAKPSQESRCPVNCEMVYSYQLFSASVAEEQREICTGKSTRKDQSPTSGPCLSRTPHMSKESQMDNLPLGSMPNSGVQSNLLESSVTPDGLIPGVAEHLVHQVIESAAPCSSEEKDVDALSQPLVRRKRKAQQLNSSDSELSAEDDYLPSLAQIFRSHQEPLPSTKRPQQKSDLPNQDGDQLKEHRPKAGLDHVGHLRCPLSEAEPGYLLGHVSPPHKQDTPENVVTNILSAGQDGSILPRTCRDEGVTSSQGSVDLFGTPDESEAVDCRFGNAGLSMDSSQYSSEVINTQQREEMQRDLCRLKRMMALVSEALDQKESDSRARPCSDASDQNSGAVPGADFSKATPHVAGTRPDRVSGPAPRPACLPEMPHVPQTWPPLSRAQSGDPVRSLATVQG
ncbi:uncharacterized protein LOC143510974 isoform X2 [Brachyhypopomus gauderio]|uniref:uncharacterized protein LOC143510974 isoform X2 n=1 Tax=Brachyhypopomus gauderio TaxID=698409 RepID=UPI004042D0D3